MATLAAGAGRASGWVLLVDDSLPTRTSLSILLRMARLCVEAAADGREALERLRGREPPGLILLDLMMPGMDGWEFLRVRAADPALRSVPVVVCSAVADRGDTALLAGVQGVEVKPADPARLVALARAYCDDGGG